jgi:Arc/MetJ-type ribon-helix-helix transcriptional regulator
MGNRVVPVRLDEDVLSLVEDLVELGIYETRSDALRDLIKAGAEQMKWFKEISNAVNKLFELEKKRGDIPLKLEGALKEMLEERTRM